MSNGREGTVFWETPEGSMSESGTISIEESGMVTVVRVRTDYYEHVVPWNRVISIKYG